MNSGDQSALAREVFQKTTEGRSGNGTARQGQEVRGDAVRQRMVNTLISHAEKKLPPAADLFTVCVSVIIPDKSVCMLAT